MRTKVWLAKGGNLPVKRDLRLPFFLTVVVTILMTVASIGSLLFPESIYTSSEQRITFLTNDFVNLLVGLPMMVVTMLMVWRGKLLSLVIWPGALMYVIYNYLAYIFGMPLSWVTGINAVLVILSLASGVILIYQIDLRSMADSLAESGPRLFSAVLMIIFGAGFFIQAAQIVAGYASGNDNVTRSEFGVFIGDLVVSLLWIAGGLLLLLRKPLGYPLGWGGMFGVVMLNFGLLVFLVLQPALMDLHIEWVDLIVIATFTILCALPMGLFIRDLNS